jgi:hypothetical protein
VKHAMIVFASLIHPEVVCTSSSAIIWQLQFTYAAHQRTNFSSFVNLTSYGPWPASVYAGSPTHKLFFFYKRHVLWIVNSFFTQNFFLSTTLNETLSRPANQKISVDLVSRSTLHQIVGKVVISYLPRGVMSRDRGSRKQEEEIKKSWLQSS